VWLGLAASRKKPIAAITLSELESTTSAGDETKLMKRFEDGSNGSSAKTWVEFSD